MNRTHRSRGLRAAAIIILIIALSFTVFAFSRYPVRHFGLIRANADKYGLDPAFVCAVIHTESKFREDALSPKGASGLMQITEPTADWIAGQIGVNNYSYSGILDPALNIRLGCYYMRWLLDRYGGDAMLALAAYNAGIGNVDKWLQNPDHSADGSSLDIIPFQETRDFVGRVENAERIYRAMLKLVGRFL